MTQEIAIRDQAITVSPQDVVANATIQAKLLMQIVDQTNCYQLISGKKYLQVEAWETIGAFNRVHAVTEWTSPIMRDGEVVGYDAKVNLFNASNVNVGCAIMPCYFTENACKGKAGDARDKAAKSAAQTFATSKAYRMNYSYIAILAGYQPTPAEEMTGDAIDDRPANLEHWCEEHQTKWFKRGKMKSYAHPIDGTDPVAWCHEPKEETRPEVTMVSNEAAGTELYETNSGLYEWIATNKAWKDTKAVRSWIVNACKISEDRIDSDPEGVQREIAELEGWTV